MANRRNAIPSKELELKIVGPRNSLVVPRAQRLNFDTNVNSTDVDEIGNPNHAGITVDSPEATLGFSVFDVGIKLFATLTGVDPAAYPAAGVNTSALGEIDGIVQVKDATVSDYTKSGHARKMQIRDFNFNYTLDGEATEDYTAIGSEKRWFKNDVVVDRSVVAGTTITLTQTPITLKNGNKLLSVIVDGVYFKETTSTAGAQEYSVSGTTVTVGTAVVAYAQAVYHASPAGNNWSNVLDNSLRAAVKGKDVKIIISADTIDRVQSVSIKGNLKPEPVKEMGNREIVGYQRQVQTIEGDLTVLDTDTDLISLLTTGSASSADTEFSIGIGCVASGVSLKIKLIDPCDTTSPYDVLKTVYIPQISIVGDSFTSNVNGNASQTFNWKSATGECYVYSGSY
jgi:hypothetical protein